MSTRIKFFIAVAVISIGTVGVVVSQQTASTTAQTTTTTATTHRVAQPASAIWPFATTATRFAGPVPAARAFATTYLGMVHPIVGTFRRGDSRSGEVVVRATKVGVETTILVRQLDSTNSWWVIGASCPDIVVVSPSTSQAIGSSVMLRGRSTAYEAVVNVDIRQDGTLVSLKRDRVMGGSMGVMGPFHKRITFPRPSSPRGAIMLRTISAKDGHIIEASVLRIAFVR